LKKPVVSSAAPLSQNLEQSVRSSINAKVSSGKMCSDQDLQVEVTAEQSSQWRDVIRSARGPEMENESESNLAYDVINAKIETTKPLSAGVKKLADKACRAIEAVLFPIVQVNARGEKGPENIITISAKRMPSERVTVRVNAPEKTAVAHNIPVRSGLLDLISAVPSRKSPMSIARQLLTGSGSRPSSVRRIHHRQ